MKSNGRRRGLYILGGLLGLEVLVVVLAPLLSPYDPTAPIGPPLASPSFSHLLGTDNLGRDVLSRTLWGGRGPLLTAVGSVLVGALAGVPLGMFAGYNRSFFSAVIMRLTDMLLAFPALIFGFVVVAILGPGELQVGVAIALSFVPVFIRITYTSTLSVRQQDYMLASQALGLSNRRLMFRHVLPNIWSELLVVATSAFGWALLLEATLSFLGLGAQPPTADWGTDLSSGREVIATAWWTSVAPGVALTITILLGNLIGDEYARSPMRKGSWRSRRRLVSAAVGALPGVGGLASS